MVKPRVARNRDEAKELGQTIQSQVSKVIRKLRNPEMYIGLSDDLMNMRAIQPTAEIKARFEEVFDRDQRENLRIVLHPLLKRWTIFERTWHKGQPLYHPVCMFHGDKVEGHLPPDLRRSDRMLDHLTGEIGDFRNVSYGDLEFVEKCDFRKYGWERVDEFLAHFDDEVQREEQRILDDRLDDFLDYNFWLAMRDAQAHYSQPWSTRSMELKSDPARYHVEERNGFKVRTRVWGEEGDMNEMKAVVQGKLDDYWDNSSASGRAAARILEIKNENYYYKHGVTLWEAANEVVPEDSKYKAAEKDSVSKDKVNKDQVEEMKALLAGVELPEQRMSLEDWLIDILKEKVVS